MPTSDPATDDHVIARSVLTTDTGLRFLGARFTVSPGDAVLLQMRAGQAPRLWLPPGP